MEIPSHIVAPEGIVLHPSKINKRIIGAWCTTDVKKGSLFGPFKGEIVKENERRKIDFRYAWEVYDLNTSELVHIINATDPNKGDWTRYVNCARYLEEQNLVSVQEEMQVYYKAIRDIPAGEELLTWFERRKIKENKKVAKTPEQEAKSKGSPKKKGKRTKSDSSLGLAADISIGGKRQRKRKKLYDNEEVSFSELIPKKRRRKLSDPIGLKLDTAVENAEELTANTTIKPKGRKKMDKAIKSKKEKDIIKEKEEPEKKEISEADEKKMQEIESNWKYPLRHNEYQFEVLGHFPISMNNRRMYKCDICSGLYRHTFSLKRHYLRNHINCCYLSKGDLCNCMIMFPSQYLAMQKANSPSVLDKIAQKISMPKGKKDRTEITSEKTENSAVVMVKIENSEDSRFPGLFRCNVCNKVFDDRQELMAHSRDHPVLPDAKLFACPLCNMTFRFKMNLVRHQLVHQGKDMPTVNKMNEMKVKVEHPMYESGDPLKPFACPKCNMKFKYSSNLVKHEAVHSELRPCHCSVCGKSFPTPTNLKKHMNIHIGLKVPCKNCDSIFSHVGGLRKHIRIVHPEVHRQRLQKLLEKKGKLSVKSTAGLQNGETEDKAVTEVHKEIKVKKRGRKRMSLLKMKPKDGLNKITKKEDIIRDKNEASAQNKLQVADVKDTEDSGKKHNIMLPLKKEKKNKAKFEDGIDSRFKFSCVICKKRFTEYLNMCRHRRVAHENPEKLKYEGGLKSKGEEKAKNDEAERIVESPEEIAAFYATVAYNIAENLNCYLDGGQAAVANCKALIKASEEEEVPNADNNTEEIVWEQYNFPQNYNIQALSENFEYDPTDPDKEKEACKPTRNYFDIDENWLDDRSPAQCLRRRGSRESKDSIRGPRDSSRSRDSTRDDSSSRDTDRDDSTSRDASVNTPVKQKVLDQDEKHILPINFDKKLRKDANLDDRFTNVLRKDMPVDKCEENDGFSQRNNEKESNITQNKEVKMISEEISEKEQGFSQDDQKESKILQVGGEERQENSQEYTEQIIISQQTKEKEYDILSQQNVLIQDQVLTANSAKSRQENDVNTGVVNEESISSMHSIQIDDKDDNDFTNNDETSMIDYDKECDIQDSEGHTCTKNYPLKNEKFVKLGKEDLSIASKLEETENKINNEKIESKINHDGDSSRESTDTCYIYHSVTEDEGVKKQSSDSETGLHYKSEIMEDEGNMEGENKYEDLTTEKNERLNVKDKQIKSVNNDMNQKAEPEQTEDFTSSSISRTEEVENKVSKIVESESCEGKTKKPDHYTSLRLFINDDTEEDNTATESLLTELRLAKGKMSMNQEEKDDKIMLLSPFHNFDSIKFGSLGEPVYVCSVCKRHYPDFDGLIRHQWKKHPSINCHFMEVEQGLDIEDLFYSEPCSRGILGSTGKVLENILCKTSYTCSRCKGSFKSPDRLRVHIINCATPSPTPKKKKYYKRKTPTKGENADNESPLKIIDLKELNSKIKQLSNDTVKDVGADKTALPDVKKKKIKENDTNVKVKKDIVKQKSKFAMGSEMKTPEKRSPNDKALQSKEKGGEVTIHKKSAIKVDVCVLSIKSEKRRKKSANQMYNPRNHVRRRELTEVLDKHQCKGCGVKFKSISLLERHVKKCDGKDKFKDLKVIKSNVNEMFHQKHKHACIYCDREFTYPKTLMNHLRAFCVIKKEKVKKGTINQTDLNLEGSIIARLKQQEEDRKFRPDDDNIQSGPKKGWPRGLKRKPKRKSHSWTYIKRRKSAQSNNVTEKTYSASQDMKNDDDENLVQEKSEDNYAEDNTNAEQCESVEKGKNINKKSLSQDVPLITTAYKTTGACNNKLKKTSHQSKLETVDKFMVESEKIPKKTNSPVRKNKNKNSEINKIHRSEKCTAKGKFKKSKTEIGSPAKGSPTKTCTDSKKKGKSGEESENVPTKKKKQMAISAVTDTVTSSPNSRSIESKIAVKGTVSDSITEHYDEGHLQMSSVERKKDKEVCGKTVGKLKKDLKVPEALCNISSSKSIDISAKKLTFHMYDGSNFLKNKEKEGKLKTNDSKFHVFEEEDFKKKFAAKESAKSLNKLNESPSLNSKQSQNDSPEVQEKKSSNVAVHPTKKFVKMSSFVRKKPDKFVFHSTNFAKN